MHSSILLPFIFSATALAQSSTTRDSDTIFPVPLFGYPANLDNIQASAVSFSGDNGVLTLSCLDANCPLKPTPTLTLGESAYRLNLGTVVTQTCSQTFTDAADTALTAVCTQSTSGVDQSSKTVTYSGDAVHYATVTLTGGLAIFSSALSSFSAEETETIPIATRSNQVSSTDGSAVSTSLSSAISSITATASVTTSASTNAVSSTATHTGGAAGIAVGNHHAGVAGALVGAFAWLLL